MSTDLKLFAVVAFVAVVAADVIVPDAVLHEATRDAARLGAQDIIDWMKEHRAHIEVAPTKAYQIYDAARAMMPGLREAGLGERAAVEVIEEPNRLTGSERGVLLF